jgi:hypothetical protein
VTSTVSRFVAWVNHASSGIRAAAFRSGATIAGISGAPGWLWSAPSSVRAEVSALRLPGGSRCVRLVAKGPGRERAKMRVVVGEREGAGGYRTEPPFVPGGEGAGTVASGR